MAGFLCFGLSSANAQDEKGYVFETIPMGNQVPGAFNDWISQAKTLMPNLVDDADLRLRESVVPETDDQGVLHYIVDQYVDGKSSECMLRLHVRNNRLIAFNGQVKIKEGGAAKSKTPQNYLSAAEALSKAGIKSNPEQAELKYIMVDNSLVPAYVVMKGFGLIYVHALKGEVIRTESMLVSFADDEGTAVTGTANTFYYGPRQITSTMIADDKYILHDNVRKIYTYDASYSERLEQKVLSIMNLSEAIFYPYCEDFINPTPDWTDVSFGFNLKGFMIDSKNPIDIPSDLTLKIFSNNTEDEIVKSYPIQTIYSKLATVLALENPVPYSNRYTNYACLISEQSPRNPMLVPMVSSTDYCITDEPTVVQMNGLNGFQPALDSHWGLEMVYDFYKDVLNRNGFDNQGTALRSYFNFPGLLMQLTELPANAVAMPNFPEGVIMFGTGYPTLSPLTTLETTGHEFTHLVAKDLKNTNESGALNEGFADIMGAYIKNHVLNQDTWDIGALLNYPKGYRNFANPMCYNGHGWLVTDDDQGGIHTNNGVINHWFYLLCKGAEGTNEFGTQYNVKNIDKMDALKIAYYTLVGYQFPNMLYKDAVKASVLEAAILYGDDSQEVKSVKEAWRAVGLDTEFTPTGVLALKSSASSRTTNASYNVAGMKVDDSYHGIVISEGNKVVR